LIDKFGRSEEEQIEAHVELKRQAESSRRAHATGNYWDASKGDYNEWRKEILAGYTPPPISPWLLKEIQTGKRGTPFD
jgi:hypothetical protein